MAVVFVLMAMAVALAVLDRVFGLGFIPTGFAALAALGGGMIAFGMESDHVQEILMVLAPLVFIPIVMRMSRFHFNAIDENAMDAAPGVDRNAVRFLQYLDIGNNILQVFVFHLAVATLLISFSMTVTSFSISQHPIYAGIHPACAFLTSKIASRFGASGVWNVMWTAVGLFVVGTVVYLGAILLNDWLFNDGILVGIFLGWITGDH